VRAISTASNARRIVPTGQKPLKEEAAFSLANPGWLISTAASITLKQPPAFNYQSKIINQQFFPR
jgi:hypothetical protein